MVSGYGRQAGIVRTGRRVGDNPGRELNIFKDGVGFDQSDHVSNYSVCPIKTMIFLKILKPIPVKP